MLVDLSSFFSDAIDINKFCELKKPMLGTKLNLKMYIFGSKPFSNFLISNYVTVTGI